MSHQSRASDWAIAFDLDMTLVDSRPASRAALERMAAEHGYDLDAGVWSTGKIGPLRDESCWAFVGDHADDMGAAKRAGSIAVGVSSRSEFPCGADIELNDLTEFPGWLERQRRLER